MFSQAIRSAVHVVSILTVIAFIAAGLCLGGLGFGWLLNALIPAIDFGTAVLIAVVALGFSSAMVLAVFLLFPLGLGQLEDEQEPSEIGEDGLEFPYDEFAISAEEKRAMLLGRFVELPKRSDAPNQAQSSKIKRRRRPKPRRGGN